jgi:hypothetical protein
MTLNLPASPANGQTVYIYMDAVGTTLNPNGNGIIAGGAPITTPIALTGNPDAQLRLIYTAGIWYNM